MLIECRWQAGRRETGGGHLQSGGSGVGGGAAPVPAQHGVRETETEQGDHREGVEGDQAETAGSRTERGEHRERRQSSQRGGVGADEMRHASGGLLGMGNVGRKQD